MTKSSLSKAFLLLGLLSLDFSSSSSSILTTQLEAKNKLNVANPQEHIYVKPEASRENHRLTEEAVNEFRVYDFYSRQADHYIKSEKVPHILPAFPGLDAGLHGHWGKYNQNGHTDGRWNDMQHENVVGGHISFNKSTKMPSIEGGLIISLNEEKTLHAVFSPRDLNIIYYWRGNSFKLDPFRWGTSRSMHISDKPIHATPAGEITSQHSKYYGYYLYNNQAVFSYQLHKNHLLETLGHIKGTDVITRTFEIKTQNGDVQINLGPTPPESTSFHLKLNKGMTGEIISKSGESIVNITKSKVGDTFKIYLSDLENSKTKKLIHSDTLPQSLSFKTKGGQQQLKQQSHTTKGTLSTSEKAYVIDDIDLPFDNERKSLMFLTGIDFDKKGHAYITTLMGEVWKVSGLHKNLNKVKWQKIASGLNQPFGLRIWDDKIYTLERTRISILHDLNNDGEIDYFENYNNQIPVRAKSHTHKFGLERNKRGDIYFINDTTICKVDGVTKQFSIIATGVRNCMGVGTTLDGAMLFGPQEGTNTPTTEIIEVHEGDFYGHKGEGPVAAPMCYIPRGVDSSVGGFFQVNDSRWGPLGKSIIGLSYGYSQWYQVLRQPAGERTQGATVPMPGEFFSGVVRAATNPVDGQVYTVGLDGWGDYSAKDGCFHRIRYTEKPLYQPTNYKVFHNGLQLDFSIELDKDHISKVKNYFAQMWDYVNSKQYGSPEYSVSQPDKLGHDLLKVSSVQLLENGKSIFVEIPDLQPVMQMHLRMHLKSAEGHSFKTDIFPTIIKLENFYNFKNAVAKNTTKNEDFNLRYIAPKAQPKISQSGEKDDHARKITINAIAGMKYSLQSFKAKAGESIQLIFNNKDGMPHNLVIAKPGQYEKVGMAAFKMLNDPKAAAKHYVPKMDEVIAYTYIVQPKGKHTTYFKVPKEKGTYKFLCTFPGHWQLMHGEFIVE